jgi:hypothetical protein
MKLTDRAGQEHDVGEVLAEVRETLNELTARQEQGDLPEDLQAIGGLALVLEPALVALIQADAVALHYDRVARSRKAQGMPWYVYRGIAARLRQALLWTKPSEEDDS